MRKKLLNGVDVCALKGHTLDCIGVFDERTHMLLSGDALQGAGVGQYRCSLKSRAEYLQTLENLKSDKRIENILFSPPMIHGIKMSLLGRKK